MTPVEVVDGPGKAPRQSGTIEGCRGPVIPSRHARGTQALHPP